MARFCLALCAFALVIFTSAGAPAQEATPAAAQPDFFAAMAGYAGGAEVSFKLNKVNPSKLLVVNGGMAQYATEADAINAIAAVKTSYLDYLKRENTIGFDFSGIELVQTPKLGDESASVAGTVLGLDENPDLNLGATFVRIGSVVFGAQGVSLLGNPSNDVQLILEEILRRQPMANQIPIDGSFPEAAIWTWLPTYDDLDGSFTMDRLVWTNVKGVESEVELIAPPESE